MKLIDTIRERNEEKRQAIAKPYVSTALNTDRNRLLNFFKNTRIQEREQILKSLENIKYAKPWTKGTSNDDAFNLAVQEAMEIVRSVMK